MTTRFSLLLVFLGASGACSLPSGSSTDSGTTPGPDSAVDAPGQSAGDADRSASPPWVRIAYPAKDSSVCGEFDVFVWGIADHPSADPTTIRLSVDGRVVSSGPAPFIYRWKTSSGRHVLKADAQDAEGQRASDSIEVTGNGLAGASCDNPPAVILSKPLFREDKIIAAPVVLEAEAHDDVGVTRVQFFVDGALIEDATRAPFSANWDTTLFAEGYHLVRLLATDTAGKTGKDELRIAIDRTPPELVVMEPADSAQLKGLVHIRATASDNIKVRGLVLTIKSVLGGAEVEIVSADPQRLDHSWDTSAVAGGRYDLSFLAFDGAGTFVRERRTVSLGLDDGTPCTTGRPCRTGLCIDGVCCTSCAGPCQTCGRPEALGICSMVMSQEDPGTCADTKTCDSSGRCVSKVGQPCAASVDCLSGFCADGVCCTAACTGACQACNVPGSIGTCVPVKGVQDLPFCTGARSCDAQGECRNLPSGNCIGDSDCLSGHCVGAVCCETACDTACFTCSGTSSQNRGRCVPQPKGFFESRCKPSQLCDGAGACKLREGLACAGNADCLTGLCVDGVCCISACNGNCQTCNHPSAPGLCSLVIDAPDPDTCDSCDESGTCPILRNGRACSGDQACSSGHCIDGVCGPQGNSLLGDGQACTAGPACRSGNCVDGVCCDTACTGSCTACNVFGRIGVCSAVPAQISDPPTCVEPSVCDGNRVCKP